MSAAAKMQSALRGGFRALAGAGLLAVAATLSACGGGGGSPSVPSVDTPPIDIPPIVLPPPPPPLLLDWYFAATVTTTISGKRVTATVRAARTATSRSRAFDGATLRITMSTRDRAAAFHALAYTLTITLTERGRMPDNWQPVAFLPSVPTGPFSLSVAARPDCDNNAEESGFPAFGETTPGDCSSERRNYQTAEFRNQYGLRNIGADAAYAYGEHYTGRPFSGRGVTVAVVDSGVDYDHPEFEGRMLLTGFDTIEESPTVTSSGGGLLYRPDDADGHGTAVAAIIAANKDFSSTTGAGMHGIAYEADILPLRIPLRGLSTASKGIRSVSDGLEYVMNFAFVVNNSWGQTDETERGYIETSNPFLRFTAKYERPGFFADLLTPPNKISALRGADDEDSIVVFSAGNDGWNSETGRVVATVVSSPEFDISSDNVLGYDLGDSLADIGDEITFRPLTNIVDGYSEMPMQYPELQGHWLVAVAVDSSNRIASFSNGCGVAKGWCLAAPGVRIRTADILENEGGGRQVVNGTSFAAPHVSGAAAVLKSAFPNLGAKQIVTLLLVTAQDLGDFGVDDVYGHGLVDLEKATRPQLHPDCVNGYQCPRNSGLRIAYARSDKSGGLVLADFGDSDLARSRVAASPALSPKAKHIPVGFMDGYDRAYQADFANFVQPVAAAPSGFFFHPRMKTTEARDGFYVRGAGGEAPQAVGWKTNTGAAFADVFEVRRNNGMSFSESDNRPGAAFAFALGTDTMRGMRVNFGDFALGVSEAESSSGARVRQAAVAMTGGGSGWNIAGEGGAALESGSVLGAKFGGAFALRNARTFYGKLSGEAKLFRGDGLSPLSPFRDAKVFAGGMAGWTDATPGAGAVAGMSELRSHGWEAGLSGERWRLSYVRPLRSSSGTMRIRTVGGYDESGSYVVRESAADLSSPRLWRARAEWTDGEWKRLRAEVGERRRMNFAAEFLF